MSDFESLGLAGWLVRQVSAMGFKKPTPVQALCIPPILEGKDCIGCAKTGSGKTAAFALPILDRLSQDPYGIFALVITPTRELAYQIADQFRVFGRHIGLKDAVIVGGIDMMKQSLSLARKPHVVIATPGRLADHLRSTDTVSLKKIKFLLLSLVAETGGNLVSFPIPDSSLIPVLPCNTSVLTAGEPEKEVLDEADRLLDSSFEEDLETIFEALPQQRQTLLFSATLTDTLSRLREVALNQPFYWQAPAEVATVEELDQRYLLMPAKVKDCYLVHLLNQLHDTENKTVILFTHTCRSCQVYGLLLRQLDFPCVALHSLMSQGQRLASLARFKSGQVRLLVATDVASRGLDIPTVEVVLNVNVPASPKDYIHRVGRTARAGRGGLAITLVTQHDIQRVKNIEADIKMQLTEYTVKEGEVLKQLNLVTISKREVELRLSETSFGERRRINHRKRKILETLDHPKAKKRKNKY